MEVYEVVESVPEYIYVHTSVSINLVQLRKVLVNQGLKIIPKDEYVELKEVREKLRQLREYIDQYECTHSDQQGSACVCCREMKRIANEA
jgi:hypothetical protein